MLHLALAFCLLSFFVLLLDNLCLLGCSTVSAIHCSSASYPAGNASLAYQTLAALYQSQQFLKCYELLKVSIITGTGSYANNSVQVHVAGVPRADDDERNGQRRIHSHRQRPGFPGWQSVLHLWLDWALCPHQHSLFIFPGGDPFSFQQHQSWRLPHGHSIGSECHLGGRKRFCSRDPG